MPDEHGLKMNIKSKSAARRKVLPSGKRRSGNSYVLLLGLEVGQTPALLKRIKEGLGYNSWKASFETPTYGKRMLSTLCKSVRGHSPGGKKKGGSIRMNPID